MLRDGFCVESECALSRCGDLGTFRETPPAVSECARTGLFALEMSGLALDSAEDARPRACPRLSGVRSES